MPVRIEIDKQKILFRVGFSDPDKMAKLAEVIKNDCNEYCKEERGTLKASADLNSDLKHGLIVWATPYAARQYYMIPTASTDKNPKATWRWCEAAKAACKDRWLEQAKRLAGG